jgi:hypothetical protein
VWISDIRAFAAAPRNSLLAGNLTGNFQNSADFVPFRPPERLDRMTYQYVRRQFPAPVKTGNFFVETATSPEGQKDVGTLMLRGGR